MKMVLPWSRYFTADEEMQYRELIQKLLPLLWFTVGYCLVLLLRCKTFPWPKGLWTFEPLMHTQHRRDRPQLAPSESKLEKFLQKHRLKVNYLTQLKTGKTIVPCLELNLPEKLEAFQVGDYQATLPYAVEQTADVYYRKFKEPLPDPASRLLESIEVLEEQYLDEFNAVFKRRLLKFRNETPSLIKRFVSSDYIEYIEDSLLDKQNQIFYVYIKNESYQSLGILEDFSVYKVHSEKSQWTALHQVCRVHIISSSLFFFRSKIESFMSSYYCKNASDVRRYHLQRLEEELGEQPCRVEVARTSTKIGHEQLRTGV